MGTIRWSLFKKSCAVARILALNPPFRGMSTIVNVLQRVGPQEPNDVADVRVVQRLIAMAGRGSSVSRIGLPAVTGSFDAATGFWIYHLQNVQRRSHPQQIVDGIVSPARGSTYSGNDYWVIVMLNGLAKEKSPGEYAALLCSGGV